uniref:HNH endonuclease signature motif containing protein n=1 Tax=Nocardioides speluncae TaxID=2670337 RepID=UPI001F0C874D
KDLGCPETLDVRRALALGDLARTQLGLDLTTSEATKTRQVVLHVHLTDTAISGGGTDAEVARLEEGDRLLLADQVRDWCHRPDTQVVVKPVIDLRERIATAAYEIPDRIRDHVIARDPTCVFPHCSRNARSCDLDHITPYARGGRTATDNLAPLCRRHHRLKTHAGWTYHRDPDGTYHWTSPHRLAYQRDHQGTVPLDPAPARPRPRPRPPDE